MGNRYMSSLAICILAATGCRSPKSPESVATVNGRQITQSDLDKAYRQQIVSTGPAQERMSADQENALRLQIQFSGLELAPVFRELRAVQQYTASYGEVLLVSSFLAVRATWR